MRWAKFVRQFSKTFLKKSTEKFPPFLVQLHKKWRLPKQKRSVSAGLLAENPAWSAPSCYLLLGFFHAGSLAADPAEADVIK